MKYSGPVHLVVKTTSRDAPCGYRLTSSNWTQSVPLSTCVPCLRILARQWKSVSHGLFSAAVTRLRQLGVDLEAEEAAISGVVETRETSTAEDRRQYALACARHNELKNLFEQADEGDMAAVRRAAAVGAEAGYVALANEILAMADDLDECDAELRRLILRRARYELDRLSLRREADRDVRRQTEVVLSVQDALIATVKRLADLVIPYDPSRSSDPSEFDAPGGRRCEPLPPRGFMSMGVGRHRRSGGFGIVSNHPRRRNSDAELRALERKVFSGDGTASDKAKLCAWWERQRTGKVKPPRKPRPQPRAVRDPSAEGGWSQIVKFEGRTFLKDDSEANQQRVLRLRDLSEGALEEIEAAAPEFSQNGDNNGEVRRVAILDMHYGSYTDLTGEEWWFYLVRVEGMIFTGFTDDDPSAP